MSSFSLAQHDWSFFISSLYFTLLCAFCFPYSFTNVDEFVSGMIFFIFFYSSPLCTFVHNHFQCRIRIVKWLIGINLNCLRHKMMEQTVSTPLVRLSSFRIKLTWTRAHTRTHTHTTHNNERKKLHFIVPVFLNCIFFFVQFSILNNSIWWAHFFLHLEYYWAFFFNTH